MNRVVPRATDAAAGNLLSVFCRFGRCSMRTWLALFDTTLTRRSALAVIVNLSVVGLAAPYPALAQAPTATVEKSDMTPARFLQMLKDIAALGISPTPEDIARIVGVELIQSTPKIEPKGWGLNSDAEKPVWLRSVRAFIGPQDTPPRIQITIYPNAEVLCIRLRDVLAAFDGDYFVGGGVSFRE
jgi:hypothetical protein